MSTGNLFYSNLTPKFLRVKFFGRTNSPSSGEIGVNYNRCFFKSEQFQSSLFCMLWLKARPPPESFSTNLKIFRFFWQNEEAGRFFLPICNRSHKIKVFKYWHQKPIEFFWSSLAFWCFPRYIQRNFFLFM